MRAFQDVKCRRAGVLLAAGICVAVLLGTVERAAGTWSIIIVDTRTREIAVGSATCLSDFDLLAGLPVVLVDVGGAAAQSVVDGTGSNRMLIRQELLNGTPPDLIIDLLAAQDGLHQSRQYGIVDVQGRATTFTGTNASAFANGVIGQTGTLVYAIQGNILTGAPVIAMAEQAVLTTDGDVPAKLMAGMLAARAMGGDGRCSCQRESPGSSPTDCGSPPAVFAKAADIGFMVVARTGDRDGVCNGEDGCANGDYFMSFNVKFQSESAPDPVFQLQTRFDARRAELIGRVDAVQSTSSVDLSSFVDDGTGMATLTFTLRDWQGSPVVNETLVVTVEHAADSAGTTAIGPVINDGGGAYHVDLTGSDRGGRDRFLVAVCDPVRPVVLIPRPSLLSICTSLNSCDDNQFCNGTETCDLGTGECEAGAAPCTGNEICNEVDDRCDPITCRIASAPLAELLDNDVGMPALNSKNRAVSIRTADPQRDQAIRVKFISLPAPFDIWNSATTGQSFFVGEPFRVCENSGQGRDTVAPDDCGLAGGMSRNWYWAAPLVCNEADAHVTDWRGVCDRRSCGLGSCVGGLNAREDCSTDEDCAAVLHLFHEGIIPTLQVPDGARTNADYIVQVVDNTCAITSEAAYSLALEMTQAQWGDVVLNIADCPNGAPDGDVSVTSDTISLVNKFSNVGCPVQKARADLLSSSGPGVDFIVDVFDIVATVNAFQGFPYPFGSGQCGTLAPGRCNGGFNHNSLCANDSDCSSNPCGIPPLRRQH